MYDDVLVKATRKKITFINLSDDQKPHDAVDLTTEDCSLLKVS